MELSEIVSRVKTRTATLESKVSQLDGRLGAAEEFAEAIVTWRQEVDQALDDLQDSPTKATPIEWWTVTELEVAGPALVDLGQWVDRVYVNAGGSLHPCWPLHGQQVTELLSLRAMHKKATRAKGPDDYSSWLKLRRENAPLIAAIPSKCSTVDHVMFGDHYTVDLDQLDLYAVAKWWIEGYGLDGTIPAGLDIKAEDDR